MLYSLGTPHRTQMPIDSSARSRLPRVVAASFAIAISRRLKCYQQTAWILCKDWRMLSSDKIRDPTKNLGPK
jgi:hypothetical protein